MTIKIIMLPTLTLTKQGSMSSVLVWSLHQHSFQPNLFSLSSLFSACKDLLIKCLTPSPILRFTLRQIVSHPWFKHTHYQRSYNVNKTQQWSSFYNGVDGFHLEVVTIKQVLRLNSKQNQNFTPTAPTVDAVGDRVNA